MIQFRTQRLATSVVNRIMAAYDGMPQRAVAGKPSAPEQMPQTQVLDAKLAEQKPPVDADQQTTEAIALSAGGLL
jgi:hypothetical protein